MKVMSYATAAKTSIGAALIAAAASANAALPEVISTQLDTVKSDGLDMANLFWPIVAAIFGAAVLFKLFKRFGSKI